MRATLLAAAAALAGAPFAASAQAPFPDTGRDLAASCAICHGTQGTNAGGMPNVAGQSKPVLVGALRDFRDGKRPATIMHQLAKGLTEEQIDAVATYWA
ncbi:MAG: c-type cytochrome, partial [Geminicoccales bacterium]